LNKKKEENKGHITKGRFCKIYKIFQDKMVWSRWKNAKPRNTKTDYNSYNGRTSERGKPHKNGGKRQENLNIMGIKTDRQ